MPGAFFSTATHTVSAESYSFLQTWIQRASGIVIDANKSYLLESRLGPIVEREHLGSIDTLCHSLRAGKPGLAQKVIEAMTTHETLFFRDHAPFEALRTSILPALLRERPRGHKLTLWSAAASSGQEAYSLAMMLLEMGLTPGEVSILATDLSEKVLERARAGIYGNFEVSRGLPSTLQTRYFERHGEEWQLRPNVRSMVRFDTLDLRNSLSGRGPFDVIFCRNVLIYFDAETKRGILRELRSTLARGGHLFLGTAEAVSLSDGFRRVQTADAISYIADEPHRP
ncbi:MAG: protein-glutamate O-methyltransferase CheR [Acidobacteriaceae bacterium]|nr:protein-glutamate O-methyltransferase CheR [Acidobacteriaceae bacterium]